MVIAALFIALIIAFMWGFSPILHKRVLREVSTHTSLVVSSLIYTVCTIIYGIIFKDMITNDITYAPAWIYGYLAFTAIVCGFLTNVAYFYILKKHESHIISALIYSSPVFTLIMAYLLLQERITIHGFLGVVFITIGVVFIAFNK